MNAIVEIAELFNDCPSVLIFPHINADGDALGSSFALAEGLLFAGINVKILLDEEIPFVYHFLSVPDLVVKDSPYKDNTYLSIALDTGDNGRLGNRLKFFQKSKLTVNIDHHETNTIYADYNYIDTASSSTGEIIYELLEKKGIPLSQHMAKCLYVAVATDTGGFRYSNTTSKTHLFASKMIEKGIDIAEISRNVFDITTPAKTKLIGYAIDSLLITADGRSAFITLSDEILLKAGAKEEDCEGIVNIARNISGVEFAVLLRITNDGTVKANLRSNGNIDVAKIASELSGGGHKKAAGCTFKNGESLGTIRNILLNAAGYLPVSEF